MASAGINFEGLTPQNGALQDLAELIFLELTAEDKLGAVVTFMTKQQNGKKLGFVGKKGLYGRAATGCNPEYDSDNIPVTEKTWVIKAWEIAEKICYKDLENTIADHMTRNGTDKADLTDTYYLDNIVRPFFEQAIRDLIIRYIFFGDTEAEGTLKEGVDAEKFNLIDGIWKQLFEGVTAGTTHRVTIGANTAVSIAEQYAEMRRPGAATGVLNDLIIYTPAKFRNLAGRRFYVTQAFADMLALDIQENNKGSELQWQSIFAGIQMAKYQGIDIVAIPQWDEIIQEYLKNSENAGAYDKPFRVIYTAQDNLRAGTVSEETVARLDVWFDKKERMNYLYASDTIGALVLAEEYAAVAY